MSKLSIKVLNRDLWSNAGVKAIVGEHFVFWQQYKVSQSFWKFQTWWQNLLSEFNSQIPGKWWSCKIYDLLSNHWVAPCLNSWSKNRRKYGHMEQVKDPIFKWIVALWSICNINLFQTGCCCLPHPDHRVPFPPPLPGKSWQGGTTQEKGGNKILPWTNAKIAL